MIRTARNARGLVARRAGGRLRPASLALGLSLVLAGCGSTALQATSAVPGAGQSYAVGANGELVAVDPGTGQVAGGAAGDGLTPADGLGGVTAPTTGTGATTVPGAGAPSAPSGGATNAPDVKGTGSKYTSTPGTGPIKIGVLDADVGAIMAAFGATPDKYPPFDEEFVKYYNARGGISGRKLELVKYTVKSQDNASTAAQRACATFTQDNKVDIVVNTLGGSEILGACLKAGNIAMIDGASVAQDKTMASQYPNWLIPSAMRSDRIAAVQIQQALSAGILKRGSKLGVLIEDCPQNQRVRDKVIKPAAAKAGLKVVEGSFRCVQNLVSDLAGVSNDIQRETNRFKGADVSHVIMVSAAEAFALSNFTKTASEQEYFPKYLVTTAAYPWNNSRSDSTIKISDDALPNIYGMGLNASLDTGSMSPVNAAQATAQKECAAIEPTRMNANGKDASDRPFRLQLFHAICESFRTLRAVLEGNGGRTAYPDVATAFREMLAKGGPSAYLASGTYSAGSAERTDGATALRPFKWTASKDWAYTGGPVKVP